MSHEQQLAHEAVIAKHGLDPETGRIRVPINSEFVFDMTVPLPSKDPKNKGDERYASSTDQVTKALTSASSEFLDSHGINIIRDAEGTKWSGPFLEAKNLVRWSPKYHALLETLKESNGKCVIFHKKVRGSGVLLIEELLKTNGYIGETTEPHANSICSVCGLTMKEHGKTGSTKNKDSNKDNDHKFNPARYMLVYGQNKSEIPGILQRYNSATNSDGSRYKVLIGSKVIRESYDFKDVRHMMIVDCPVNISMTLQIYGRSVRKNSHIRLEPEDRNVTIHTFVSVVNKAFPSSVRDSAEVQRYKAKMDAYLLIQKVDKYRHAYAVDASINRGTIWPTGDPGKASLGALYYDPMATVASGLSLDDLRVDTFKARKFFVYEMAAMSQIIKRLFISKSIWTYVSLWKTVCDPPFPVESNPRLFDESLFMITLSQLVNAPNFNVDTNNEDLSNMAILVNRLVDPAERRITLDTGVFRIVHCGSTESMSSGYYILVPCDTDGRPVADAGIYDQRVPGDSRRQLNIDQLLSGSHIQKKYSKMRGDILDSLDGLQDIEDFATFLLSWPVNIQELFIEDCIRAAAKAKIPDTSDIDIKALRSAAELVLSGLQVLGATVTFEELKIYKMSTKYYIKELPLDTVVGYETLESIRIMTQDNQFVNVAKSAMNRMENFREAGPVVGYIEDTPNGIPKFKLRKTNSAEERGDEYEKGIVCHTKTKEQLLETMDSLGIKPSTHRTKAYCREIFMVLMDREMDAREAMSKNKFLYSWWNTAPDN